MIVNDFLYNSSMLVQTIIEFWLSKELSYHFTKGASNQLWVQT